MISRARIPVVLFALLMSAPALADESLVQVSVEPWAAYDGVDRPFRYIVTMRATGDVEALADRRLLSFEVQNEGSRRRHRCQHPAAPRNTVEPRVRRLAAGEAWTEWIDLRMYCWGRALGALEAGADVNVRYGWRRRTRSRWVARVPESAWRDWTGSVSPEPFHFASVTGAEAVTDATETAALRVALSAGSARRGSSLNARVAVRAHEGSQRLFLRPTNFTFEVRGPAGRPVVCELPGPDGSPSPDLFRRLTTRVAWRELLELGAFCPAESFDRAGLYEVTPRLRLAHDGADYEIDAVTGTFVGQAAPFRVTSGEAGYVEQVPERAADE